MADSNLSQLLGRDFGANVWLTGEDQYRVVSPTSVATSFDMGNVSVRALLAIVEHQMLGKVATPFATRHDADLLARVRSISDDFEAARTIADRADALIREAQAMFDAMAAAQDAAGSEKDAPADANQPGDNNA